MSRHYFPGRAAKIRSNARTYHGNDPGSVAENLCTRNAAEVRGVKFYARDGLIEDFHPVCEIILASSLIV